MSNTNLWSDLYQQHQDQNVHQQALTYALEYLKGLRDQRVFPSTEALNRLSELDEPMPVQPNDPTTVLRQLHEIGSPTTVLHGNGRYFGFVNGGVLPSAMAARWLADAWDQNGALHVLSPITATLEQLCERWMVDLLGLPAGTAAGFVSGTSVASLCGMVAGRNALLKRKGWDVSEQGLFGAPPIRVVISQQAHSTVRKALSILGIGQRNIEWVSPDAQGRFDPQAMPTLDDNTLLILQAGNVNSGAFDDFVTLCGKAREVGAWVHVDGAFGLWAAACEQTKYLTAGVDLADSWSVDAHKTLNVAYDNGIILCKDRSALVSALQATGDYIQFSENRDAMLYGPEMSRRARGIELWAALKTLGRTGVDALVKQLCDHAQTFSHALPQHGFRVLNDVVFNQVMVVCESPDITTATLKNIQASGECWCGGSQWQGEPVIRISVCAWMTTSDDVAHTVATFVKAREQAQQT
jgi:glutamate/tyrosine decarboxylase-like PLP-dependent enzyme